MIPIKALMVACLVLMLLQAFALAIKHMHPALRGKPILMSYELIALSMFASMCSCC